MEVQKNHLLDEPEKIIFFFWENRKGERRVFVEASNEAQGHKVWLLTDFWNQVATKWSRGAINTFDLLREIEKGSKQ